MRNTISNAQVKLVSAELIDDLDIKVIETFLFENSQMEVECYFWVHFKVNLSSRNSSLFVNVCFFKFIQVQNYFTIEEPTETI